jgi:uncharacterized protein (TIGR03067 family)
MRGRTLLGAVVLVAFLAPVGADDTKDKAKLDPAKLVGTYTYVSGVRDGKKVDDDNLKKGTVEITKDTITLKSDQGNFVIKYKLDAKKDPATLAMEITEGPAGQGAKAGGIIAQKGDEVKLCYNPMAEDPPKEFASKEGSGLHYFVLKKKK